MGLHVLFFDQLQYLSWILTFFKSPSISIEEKEKRKQSIFNFFQFSLALDRQGVASSNPSKTRAAFNCKVLTVYLYLSSEN